MRSIQAALLAAIPAAALGAHTATRTTAHQPSTVEATAHDTATALLGGPSVRGGDALRAGRLEAALADLDADISLGEVVCSERQVDTRTERVRYTAGTRRYDNPAYRTASEALAETHAAFQRLQAEADQTQAAYSALLDQVESQDARADALRAEAAHAREATEQARTQLDQTRADLSAARSAAAHIQQLAAERSRLEGQLRDLSQQLQRQEDALARARAEAAAAAAAAEAAARPDPAEEARRTALAQAVTQARADLAAAEAALGAAREAAQAGRGAGQPPEERRVLRDALLAAQAEQIARQEALTAAEAALAAVAERPAQDTADTGEAVRRLERELHHLRRTQRQAEEALAQVQAPSRALYAQAEQADRLEERQHRQQGGLRIAERLQTDVEGRLAVQAARADALRSELAAQTTALELAQARLQAQQDLLLTQEAAVTGIPAELSQSLRDEVQYTVATWTRSCGVEATVRWQDDTGELWTRTFGAEATDTDQAHPAQAQARIPANLLDYGRSDAERVQEADAALVQQIRAALGGSPATARLGG